MFSLQTVIILAQNNIVKKNIELIINDYFYWFINLLFFRTNLQNFNNIYIYQYSN